MASSRKSNLADIVAAQLAPLLPNHLLIGLSGGMDSVVLLHLLHTIAPRFEWRLSAIHVHHGISPNADAWVNFCSELCAQYNIPLHIEHVDIAPLRDEHGIEAAARKLRHAAFAKQPCDFVVLAHHADDQAETMLLQLLRGAGVKGAAAMPVLITSDLPACGLSRMASSSISKVECPLLKPATLRPLLGIPRKTLLEYAQQHALQWVEDESNTDDSYPRNFLRHRLLPLLEERFPSYRDTLTRSAQNFAEASELLDDLAQLDAQNSFPFPLGGRVRGEGHDATLDASRLQSLSCSRAKNLLRWFLHQRGAPMPDHTRLEEMLHQICSARSDAQICVTWQDWEAHRYQGRVYAQRALGEFDAGLVVPWEGESAVHWPALARNIIFQRTQGQGISLEKLQRAPVALRLRSGGESLRPHPKAATRSLKNLLQEHHVPPWQRERLPLLYCGDELVCIPGVAVAAGFQATGAEPGIVLV